MRNHTELLNHLIHKHKLQSYLEIGIHNPKHNFNHIRCKIKIGVDPDPAAGATCCITSDEFFALKKNDSYDLIFIDGLHHADQVKKDFDNALRALNDNGFIVLHDCNPEKQEWTTVPRSTRVWNGDVYKFAVSLLTYNNIDYCTVDFDHGCTVVWKDKTKVGGILQDEVTWEFFEKNRNLLRLVSIEHFVNR